MQVHTFFIALMVFLMGLLSFLKTEELINSELGRIVSLGMGIFWSFRLVFQVFVYSTKLWRGKTFETVVHFIFTALWIYIAMSYIFVFAQLSF